MEPLFTKEQLNNMKREDLIKVTLLMQEQKSKNENEIQLLKDKQKELEFMNAMLSDRLALEQRRRFGKSSEKYADGYEKLCLFNEAEMNADVEDTAAYEEIQPASYKRKKRKGKKDADLSNFEVTETKRYKLDEEEQYCPECGTKYKVAAKEVVKRLKFVPPHFEVVEEITYSIVETALLNGLKPYLYLTYVLERLRQLGPFPKPEELDSLLPWAEELPKEIKTKTKPKK